MKIVFDARMFGHSFGIGVYTRELISRLPIQGRDHQFTFLVRPADETYIREHIVKGAKNVRLVPTKISHYSWAEQLVLPLLLMRLNAQVVHFPNFNVPIFYNGDFVVTVHDMVHHKIFGHRRDSWYKHLAYRWVMKRALFGSRAVIAVSKFSKQEILQFYPDMPARKIYTVAEGVGPEFNREELPGEIYTLREKYGIKQPYILFVGVWEVKKNLPCLATVFEKLAARHSDLQLVLAGKEDPWHPEVREQVEAAAGKYKDRLIAPGFVENEDMPALFRQAEVYVNASPNEGFGLPGVEAQACGTPVAVADTDVFREVYGQAAHYFNFREVDYATKVIDGLLLNHSKRMDLKFLGFEQAKLYSWEDTVDKTLQIYEAL